jgi:serine/threonine protein kinase
VFTMQEDIIKAQSRIGLPILTNENFKILDFLGSGIQGSVYKVEINTSTMSGQYALKGRSNVRKGIAEFEVNSQLADVCGVCKCFGLIYSKTHAYMVLELLDNHCSFDYFITNVNLSCSECIDVAIDLCESIKAIHEAEVTHEDIKSHNVMVNMDSYKVTIIDFGCANLLIDEPRERLKYGIDLDMQGFLGLVYSMFTRRFGQVPIDMNPLFVSESFSEMLMILSEIKFSTTNHD